MRDDSGGENASDLCITIAAEMMMARAAIRSVGWCWRGVSVMFGSSEILLCNKMSKKSVRRFEDVNFAELTRYQAIVFSRISHCDYATAGMVSRVRRQLNEVNAQIN